MQHQDLITNAKTFCKKTLENFPETGHDWLHTLRVLKMAEKISETEPGEIHIIQLGSLFHDIADSKFNNGNEDEGIQITENWLKINNVEIQTIEKVTHIIKNVSWHKGFQYNPKEFPELAIVQDADRLEAIGAIGIARAFNYGGFKTRPFYDENNQKTDNTLSHFYEKLIHIKDKMNTQTGRNIAITRHNYLLQYIETLNEEIKGLQ